ncbi:MAG: J domain-containing protein [Clostridiales bacterium]|nr:J domain-containing protein [Clostridiales bacterium]
MEYKDYYKTLGLDKQASQEDIKKTYRRLAKKYHPDTNQGDKQAEERFKEINEAYEVLGDPEKRKKYDTFGSEFNFQNGHNFDPSQYGFGNSAGFEFRTGDGAGFSDFFNMFFGGGGLDFDGIFSRGGMNTRAGAASYKGEDIEARLEITPEEGFHGTKRRISLGGRSGTKNINFKIPKGVKDGERIRLRGQGEPGLNGGPNGDLYLIIEMKTDGKFALDGLDLTMSLDIMPWDAALGGEKEVETIDGRVLVRIPKGIQTDNKIRLAGKGYTDRGGRRGDLYLRIRLVNPRNITEEIRGLYEKMKQASKTK